MRSLSASLLRSFFFSAITIAGLAGSGCGRHESVASLSVDWVLVNANDPNPAMASSRRCEDVGVLQVRIDTGPSGLFNFPCNAYHGDTTVIPAGYYDIQAIAFGPMGKVLAAVEYQSFYAYGVTKLADLRFPIP